MASPFETTPASAVQDGLKTEDRAAMERSISMDIREEREDLKRAAEQSLNAMLELDLECKVRWASPSWQDLAGMSPTDLIGHPITDFLVDKKEVFASCIESMRKDDSKSKIVRFTVRPSMQRDADILAMEEKTPVEIKNMESLIPDPADLQNEEDDVDLEAQGIMVYDRISGEESHTMWMIKPAISREITIDLPDILVKSLGVGAEMLANYLTLLADVGVNDPEHHPPPLPVMCRICERQITPWWFEKHTELCSQEHHAELEVQMTHEALNEQRKALVNVLDTIEAQARHNKTATSAEQNPHNLYPVAEYKGLPIGSTTNQSPGSSAGRASPGTTPVRSRESSASGFGHNRARSFAVRRPLSRIVELVLDLCDTAMEISTPAIKDTKTAGEIRTQSPQSESRVQQVMQWQSPSASSLENEQGLSLLCEDTAQLAKAKVDAVFRHRQVLEYAERIRVEYHVLVQECIEAALDKAARIAAGELSDSGSETSDYESPIDTEQPVQSNSLPPEHDISPTSLDDAAKHNSFPSAMAMALRNTSNPALTRRISSPGSSRASSPHAGATTPRTYTSNEPLPAHKRGSIAVESDAGADSDTSLRSSVASGSHRRADSPGAELTLSRVVSTRSRDRKRQSLVLPSLAASSTSRHQSPARGPPGPSSPLRIAKPRIPSSTDGMPSPITSPILMSNELHSPVLRGYSQHHHRRQSSAAMSESFGRPLSPRLGAVPSNPPPRAVQTSIKDFEIIKPISKGAFGSVYLAKKKSTGDYYAIKVLKKADMVAKNQVTNVKQERAIMMWQGESDFVAKLYWTFSSKDYLYLVMEYLNGGDCASLIKVLGTLPEDWTKKYVGEIVLCVQNLHSRQIVHRDLKPDNLLIDAKGHLKLTDFGLSRMGMIGRQKRVLNAKPGDAPPDLLKQGPFRRAPSVGSSRSTSFDLHAQSQSPAQTPALNPYPNPDLGQPSYFSLNREGAVSRDHSRTASSHRSDSGDGDALASMFRRFSLAEGRTPIEEETASEEGSESPDPYALSQITSNTQHSRVGTPPHQTSNMPPPMMALFDPEDNSRRFVGTPDYLAPETINGNGQDEMSDWWSLGCILFECLYGRPPFNADTPEQVFHNILNHKIQWPEDDEDLASPEAKDLMNKLLCLDPKERLGSNKDDKFEDGGDEIKAHSWFADLHWDTLRDDEASFIPMSENPEDTEYFDSRGATMQNFAAEFEDQSSSPSATPGTDYPDRPHDALSRVRSQVNAAVKRNLMPLHIPPHVRDGRSRRLSEPAAADDFGNFHFKNLPVLEKANKDVIQKLKADALQAQSKSASPSSPIVTTPSATASPNFIPSLDSSPMLPMPLQRTLSASKGLPRPQSPSVHSNATSSPNRGSQPSSPLLVSFSTGHHHERRKTSSGAALMPHQNFLQTTEHGLRLPATAKSIAANSPAKGSKATLQIPQSQPSSQDKTLSPNTASPRQRSHTVGSQEGDLVPDIVSNHHKRRSGVFDASPSSSDNEDSRQKALLRVQRRRQSVRRTSQQINLADGPIFRTLDVLVCEDHPVSRLVMERLLEKLRCRTITVTNGSEAMRYAMSEIKFDIIMMEYKLPQVNGADVARMIRDTKNANSHTPIVAVTGYLKELTAPHNFDALIEKPPTRDKLEEVIGRLCQWKCAPEGWRPSLPHAIPPSSLRQESIMNDDSPTTTTSSGFGGFSQALSSSREDSIGSSSFGELESQYDSIPLIISRQATVDFDHVDLERNFGGLGITSPTSKPPELKTFPQAPQLSKQSSAPAALETEEIPAPRKQPSMEAIHAKRQSLEKIRHESAAESGDDEDEEIGHTHVRQRSPKRREKRASKLGIEMMRTNSHGSVISNEDVITTEQDSQQAEGSLDSDVRVIMSEPAAEVVHDGHITPPEIFPPQLGSGQVHVIVSKDAEISASETPEAATTASSSHLPDPDPTPKGGHSPA